MAQINSGSSNLSRINGAIPKELDTQKRVDKNGPGFDEVLKEQIKKADISKPEVADVKFSKHAIERMQSRGISLKPEEMTSLSNAVKKANEKGAKETLVLTDKAAFVVSAKNNTVITAIDKALMKENVFTNIDSTVVI